ncbi:MAG TPA: hypothetical protein VIH00_12160, partial [Candidatus Limnocylindrales bacterium]
LFASSVAVMLVFSGWVSFDVAPLFAASVAASVAASAGWLALLAGFAVGLPEDAAMLDPPAATPPGSEGS